MAARVNKWHKTFNFVYSIGASIVILGVVGKLSHAPWGDYALYLGLIVEAVIFFASAFETAPTENCPTQIIENKPSDNLCLTHPHRGKYPSAPLDPNLSEKLRTGIEQLGKTAEALSKSAEAILSSRQYETQLSKKTQHLSTINSNYKNQSELSQKQLQLNKDILDQLTQAIEETKQFNTQMRVLSQKLSSLNKIYSGMLSAMQGNPAS